MVPLPDRLAPSRGFNNTPNTIYLVILNRLNQAHNTIYFLGNSPRLFPDNKQRATNRVTSTNPLSHASRLMTATGVCLGKITRESRRNKVLDIKREYTQQM